MAYYNLQTNMVPVNFLPAPSRLLKLNELSEGKVDAFAQVKGRFRDLMLPAMLGGPQHKQQAPITQR